MVDPTPVESRRNLQTNFSFNENSSAPVSRARSAQFRRDLYQTADTDLQPLHFFASTKNSRAKSNDDLKTAQKVVIVRQPRRNGASIRKPAFGTTSSTIGLSSLRRAWHLEGSISIQGLSTKAPKTWAQVIAKAAADSTKQPANKSHCKEPDEKPNPLNAKPSSQPPCKKRHYFEGVIDAQDQESEKDDTIGDVPEIHTTSRTNQAGDASQTHSDHGAECPRSGTVEKSSSRSVIMMHDLPHASPAHLGQAVAKLVRQSEDLGHATRRSKRPRVYYTYNAQGATSNVRPEGPMTVGQVQHAVIHNDVSDTKHEQSVHDSRQSYFIFPFFSPEAQSLSWLSVSHSLDSTFSECQPLASTMGEDERSSPTTPWWELKPEETIIGRAMTRRDAEEEQRKQERQTIEVQNSGNYTSTTSSSDSSLSIKPASHKSRLLDLFLNVNTLDRVEPASCATKPPPDVHSPPLSSLPSKEPCLTINFLKMTPVEKKAFYSSPAMNRITSRSITPLPTAPSPGLWPQQLLPKPELSDDGLEQSPTSDVSATILRRHSINTLASLQDFCAVGDSLRGMVAALDIRVLSEEDELTFHGGFADWSVVEMRARLFEYEEALKALPAWVEEVCVEAVVPTWFSRTEMERALQRMKIWVLVRTHGRAKWLCEIKGRGLGKDLEKGGRKVAGEGGVMRWDG